MGYDDGTGDRGISCASCGAEPERDYWEFCAACYRAEMLDDLDDDEPDVALEDDERFQIGYQRGFRDALAFDGRAA